MKEIVDVLNTARSSNAERQKAHRVFLKKRAAIWQQIQDRKFPASYVSTGNKKFIGAPRRTAIRCDFLLANKIALGSKYMKDRISDLAQRDLLFNVLRSREVFPQSSRNKIAT